ncbi:acyltransferase family protein [Niallia sp. Krafla_26]|uniref:acyltransferase family protein n=1 Tax=Niallia sp. Krafla_26 TaxID=3064703 RepID=UPI003D17F8B2
MKGRLGWLDVGKGIGMVFVIFAHDHIPTMVKTLIYTFHMPLFFFLSGFLFSPTKYRSFSRFFISKCKSLVIPYFSFSIIVYLWFLFRYSIGDIDYSSSLFKPLVGTIIGIRNSEWTVHIGALWFLSCLFITELIFYFLKTKLKKNLFVVSALIFMSLLGYGYSRFVGEPLPWNIDAAFIAVLFFGAGNVYKESVQKLNPILNLRGLLFFCFLNLTTGYFNFLLSGQRVDMYESLYGNYMLFVISAFSGIIALLIAVQKIGTNAVLEYIGRNSLIYLALHQSIVFSILNMVFKETLEQESLLSQIWIGTVYTIIALLMIAPVAYVIKNYFPYILGKSKM